MKKLSGALLSLLSIGALMTPSHAEFKIIGYVPDWSGTPSYVQWDKVTHINYAFVLPSNNTGGLTSPNASILNNVVTNAHSRGVKVLVSIGGWNDGDDSRFHAVAANPAYITTFVNNCVSLVTTYNLDGIDIDWEYPDAGASADQYVTFMSALATVMHSRGKLLTAAVIGRANKGVKPEIFDLVDFLNIMSYDGGTPHSTYAMAVADLRSWRAKGLSKDKAILGVPFYGKDPYTAYKTLVANDPSAANKDQVGNVYYNGIPTMVQKTKLAADSGGGIMIWELSQDTRDATSLLTAIYNARPVTAVGKPLVADRTRSASLVGGIVLNDRCRTLELQLAGPADLDISLVDLQGRIVAAARGKGLAAGWRMISPGAQIHPSRSPGTTILDKVPMSTVEHSPSAVIDRGGSRSK